MKIKQLTIAAFVALLLGSSSIATAKTRVYVRIAPPSPKKVTVVHKNKSHKNAVWVSGYWRWNGKKHVWVNGRWQRPRHGFVWVKGHWVKNMQGWYWVEGHWKRKK